MAAGSVPLGRCSLERKGDELILKAEGYKPFTFVSADKPLPVGLPVCPRGAIFGHYGRADGMKLSIIQTPAPDQHVGEVSKPASGVWPRTIPKFTDIRAVAKGSCKFNAKCHTLKRVGGTQYTSVAEACTLTYDPAAKTVAAFPSGHWFFRKESQ
jgi:hypothetical protein